MTGPSIFLLAVAGMILITTLCLLYMREHSKARRGWGADAVTRGVPRPALMTETAAFPPVAESHESSPSVDLAGADVAERTRRRLIGAEVFRYTIRRPPGATRKTMPDLGGFSEVPLRLYDQLGNRFTVHQKVRLN